MHSIPSENILLGGIKKNSNWISKAKNNLII